MRDALNMSLCLMLIFPHTYICIQKEDGDDDDASGKRKPTADVDMNEIKALHAQHKVSLHTLYHPSVAITHHAPQLLMFSYVFLLECLLVNPLSCCCHVVCLVVFDMNNADSSLL